MTLNPSLRTLLALGAVAGAASAQDAQDPQPAPRGAAPAVATQSAPGATASVAPQASAGQSFATIGPNLLYSSITAHASSDVPGIGGLKFQNTAGHTAPFDKPFGSANGNYIIAADSDAASTADDLLMANGVIVEREGNVASWATVGGSTMGPFQIRQGINDAGEYVFKNNTSEASTADDYVVRATSGPTYTVFAQEGTDIPQLGGAETWNDNLEGVLITSASDVAFEANIVTGAPLANDEIYVFGGTLVYQEGITVPSGQAGGATDPWQLLDFEDTWVSPDGLHTLLKGDVGGTAPTTDDDVLVYDGVVVLQENQIIPGSGFANPIDLEGTIECALDFGGNWYARGNNDTTEDDWVVRNGVVIAQVGGPIFTGSLELWDDLTFGDCFFMHTGDTNGNYVVAGVTDAVATANGVIVLNDTSVLVREGDPIDVDGNGLYDDDAFFNTFGNDKCILNDLGEFYFVASIKNAAGLVNAQGFFRLQAITPPTGPVNYCTAGTTTNNCTPTMSGTGTPSATSGSGFTLAANNMEGLKQAILFYGITGQAAAPWGGSTSFLCVKSPTQRMGAQTASGTVNLCDGVVSIDWNAYIAGNPTALGNPFSAGQVVNAQGWFRDPPSPKTTNLTDGLEFTVGP